MWRFWARLAWQCGYPHPQLLLETLDAQEYEEILAFAVHEPLPDRRADMRAAMQALITARSAGVKGVKLANFLIDTDPKPAIDMEQTQAEMNRQMAKISGLFTAAAKANRKALPAPENESTGTLDGPER